MDYLSQDLIGPERDVCGVNLHPCCKAGNGVTADPPAATSHPPPVFSSSRQGAPGGKVLHNHMQLLQALCGLHRVKGKDGDLEVQCVCPDGDAGSLFGDTVSQLLDSVVRACKEPLPVGPGDLILQACHVAVKSMDVFSSQQQPSVELMRHVEDALRELTAMLLHCGQPNRVSHMIDREVVFACT